MKMVIDFPGGEKVDAHFENFIVATDQQGSAPTPFEVFLSSIGTCAGIYVLSFCKQRNLPTEGIRIVEQIHSGEKGMIEKIGLEIQVPPTFPKQYHSALIRSAELCKVKKTLEHPPSFEIVTREVEIA